MDFIDATTVTDGLRKTQDGYLVADVRTARTGIQLYLGSEVGKPEMPVVRVYRSPEQVFDTASTGSFANKPVTMGHPASAVNSKTWKETAKGSVGSEVMRDGDFIRVPLIIMDADTIASVEGGTREISPGYSADIVHDAGKTPDGEDYDASMSNIRVNHVAIVAKGRSGSQVRIGDNAPWGVAPISKEHVQMTDALRTVLVDNLSVSTTEQGAQAITKLLGDIATLKTTQTAIVDTHAKDIALKDGEIGELKAKVAQLTDAAPKPADLDRLVAERVTLVTTAKAIVKDFDATNLSDADIRKKVVAAKMGDTATVNVSDAEISGMFKVLATTVVDPVRQALLDRATPPAGTPTNITDADVLKARQELLASFA